MRVRTSSASGGKGDRVETRVHGEAHRKLWKARSANPRDLNRGPRWCRQRGGKRRLSWKRQNAHEQCATYCTAGSLDPARLRCEALLARLWVGAAPGGTAPDGLALREQIQHGLGEGSADEHAADDVAGRDLDPADLEQPLG